MAHIVGIRELASEMCILISQHLPTNGPPFQLAVTLIQPHVEAYQGSHLWPGNVPVPQPADPQPSINVTASRLRNNAHALLEGNQQFWPIYYMRLLRACHYFMLWVEQPVHVNV